MAECVTLIVSTIEIKCNDSAIVSQDILILGLAISMSHTLSSNIYL